MASPSSATPAATAARRRVFETVLRQQSLHMQPEKWRTSYIKVSSIDMCAYGGKYKAPKVYYTSMTAYTPEGRTGDGGCNQGKCGQGEVNPATGHFVHYGKLGRDPKDGPRGPGALKEKNSYPDEWALEILTNALQHKKGKGRVVIDLFSGWQSLRKACETLGLVYVGLDVMGDRDRFIRHGQRTAGSIAEAEMPAAAEEAEIGSSMETGMPPAVEEAETRAGGCKCGIRCEPAGSDTAHGSHGFHCNRIYQRWDTARRLKW